MQSTYTTTSYGYPATRTTTVVDRSPVRTYTRTSGVFGGETVVTTRSPSRVTTVERTAPFGATYTTYGGVGGVTTTVTRSPSRYTSTYTTTTGLGDVVESTYVPRVGRRSVTRTVGPFGGVTTTETTGPAFGGVTTTRYY